MNLFRKINLLAWHATQQVRHGIEKIYNLSLTDPKSWDTSLWNLRGSQSLSGETVTEETALTYSAVFNAVTLISGTVGSLPLHLMQKQGKSKHIADDRSLYRVMHDQWNPYMTAMAGREVMMAHILTWGNGYAEKVRNVYGELVELWPISPNRVTPKMEGGELVYKIRVDGEPDLTLAREKILHIPGLGFDGFAGYSVITMARKSIGLGMAYETFSSLYFGQGTHPGIIVTHPNKLGTEGHANLKKALTDTYSGLGQSHRLMLMEEGMKPEKVGYPPKDSQFIESKIHHVTDVCRWFNIPPHKLKDLSKSSFNNIESEQAAGFVTDTILPWLIREEQNYNMQLLMPREQKEKFYFKHVVEGLLRANAKDRAEYYKTALTFGWMTENEVRGKEDLDPNPNPLADELWMMANMVPLSKYEEHLTKNKGPFPSLTKDEMRDTLKLLSSKTEN